MAVSASRGALSVRAMTDMLAPRLLAGHRVVLFGEAAVVSRPHSTSAAAKAAQDALALAEALKAKKFALGPALDVWERGQLANSTALVRSNAKIGDRMQGMDQL